jgi:hypothetical protein
MESTFLGLSKSEWELFNSFSNWLSAIGTLAAVSVSLYLANLSGKPRASVSAGHRIIIRTSDKSKPREVVSFQIVNTGDRPIRITNIVWRVGLWKKRYSVQTFNEKQSSPMPVELTYGQEASWAIPFDYLADPWPNYFSRKMMEPNFWLSCMTIKVEFHSSVGEVFRTRPEKGLINKLREARSI